MSKYPGNIVTTGADAGYSVLCDNATTSYVVMTNGSAAINPSTSGTTFTIECWVYTNGTTTTTLYAALASENYGFTLGFGSSVGIYDSTQTPWFGNFTGAWNGIRSTTPVAFRTWTHIACVFTGSTCYIYQNGVLTASGGPTSWGVTGSSKVRIGCRPDAADAFTGYIAGARVVIGTNLYPGGTTFAPPTVPLSITNTQLLTCNSPTIIDQSPNAFPLTVVNRAAVSTFTPFAGYQAYNPTLGAATPGVWTLSDALQAAATRQWNMYDPYFKETILALRTGPTDGSQNNTFLDSSSNNFPITRNGGNPGMMQGTFTPFSPTGWSVYMNSDRQSWVSVSNASLALGTGDFEISFYMFYINGTYIMGTGNTNPGSWAFTGDGSWRRDNLAADFISGGAPALRWNKIRCVRVSGVTSLYVNDVLRGSLADTRNYTVSNLGIGNFTQTAGGSPNFASEVYISNLKIVKAGTTILDTFRDNRYIDNSPTPLTVTPNNNATFQPPAILAFGPLNTNTAYSPLRHGGSGYFDGTGDFLSSTSTINFSNNPFTVEFWIYPTVSGTQMAFACATNNAMQIQLTGASGNLNASIGTYGVGNTITTTGAPILLNQWNHVVAVRSSTGTNGAAIFVNGSRNILNQVSTTYVAGAIHVGAIPGGTQAVTGWMSGMVVTNNAANYSPSSTSIPVPTAPPSPTGSTLCLNFTNAAIFDATGKNVIETVGTAQASTAQKKYGSTSMYFDGLATPADLLHIPRTGNMLIGAGDYTFECWVRPADLTTLQAILTYGSAHWRIFINAANLWFLAGATSVLNVAHDMVLNNWHHVALVRKGSATNNTAIWVNGIRKGQVTNTTNFSGGDTNIYVGAEGTGSLYKGYLQDLRLTRFARYDPLSATITIPTSLTQDQ